MTKGYFYCNKCDITWSSEYKPQQRPRRSCPTCHKSCDLKTTNGVHISGSPLIELGQLDHKPSNGFSPLKSNSIPPTFIDDPDELLLSVAIRELNKPNPDPRWATILLNCKKENISTTSEVIDQFKQLSTQGLVNILSKSLQEE